MSFSRTLSNHTQHRCLFKRLMRFATSSSIMNYKSRCIWFKCVCMCVCVWVCGGRCRRPTHTHTLQLSDAQAMWRVFHCHHGNPPVPLSLFILHFSLIWSQSSFQTRLLAMRTRVEAGKTDSGSASSSMQKPISMQIEFNSGTKLVSLQKTIQESFSK